MSQDHKHHFQDKNIEIRWGIKQGMPQQQAIYDLIPVQQNQDIGWGPGIGANVKFSNGQEFSACPNNENHEWYVSLGNNEWVPLQQKILEFQQQIPQQNQTNELQLQVEVSDYNNINEYRGYISLNDYLQKTDNLGEDLDDLSSDIEKNLQNIFDKNSPVYLKMTNQNSFLEFKLKLARGKKLIDFTITIQLDLMQQNIDEKEKMKKEIELQKQSQRLEKIEKDLNQLQQSSTEHGQGVAQLRQEVGNQQAELSNQIQYVVQNLQQQIQQSSTEHGQGIAQLRQEIGNQKAEFGNKIQYVEQNLQQQCQKLIQQQQNPFKKLSINHLQKVQADIYCTQKIQGQFEFELILTDDEAEFQFGIIADNDLDNIEKKNKSYYVDLPDGTFTRGTSEFGKFFTYTLQMEDKLGLRIDTVKNLFQLVINDYPLPPVKINQSIDEFSFIIKSSNDISTFAEIPQQY